MEEKSIKQYIDEMVKMYNKRNAVPAQTNIGKPEIQQNNNINKEMLPMDGKGSLVVVVNSAESRPLMNAKVLVTDATTGIEMANLLTDQSGKTEIISLPAPLKANSLNPNENEIVYGLYNITVSNQDYVTSTIKNIPIFDSVLSIQQFNLLWLAASGGQTEETTENEGNPFNL